MNATADNRSCRSQARWMGVCPEGAQVRRHTGWSMKPLWSNTTTGSPRRRAPFLSSASPWYASVRWLRRPLREPVVRAFGTSSPDRGALCRYNRDDTRHEIAWPPLRLRGDRSTNRCGNPPCVGQPREFSTIDASAPHPAVTQVWDVVLLPKPRGLLSPQPTATASPKTAMRQPFPPRRPRCCHPRATARQSFGGSPVLLHFLSFAYLNIRIFSINGSLTT